MDTLEIKSIDTKSQSSGGQLAVYQNSKDNVKVIIRIRPLNEREKGNGGHKKCITIENSTTISIESKPDFKSFNFDYVADEEVPQDIIFNQIAKPIADSCLEGYNGSIFAYGQTGAGKTFTIQGPILMVNGEETIYGSFKKDGGLDQNKRGIMQRSFEYIFDCVEQARKNAKSDGNQFDYLIRCSYLEIYNEQIMDLLDPSSINLHVREDIKKGVYVEGLQEEVVQNADDMIGIIQAGAKNRHVGSTSMNKESSRSHSVLTTIIETKSMKEGGVWNIKTSRFHIIDLAGSERSKYTNAVGERLKEAGMINKSLSALGNVINSLVDISEGKSRHVHYRDSKLTFLLRDSLGGNSKTLIVANISPSNICYGETLSTLKFAQRAKLIRNKAVINEDSSGTISLLKNEISRLKKQLAESEKMSKISGDNFQQCQICKALMGNEGAHDEDGLLLDDEMLISFDNGKPEEYNVHGTSGPLNEALKEKFKIQKTDLTNMRKRVVHLEGLLSANLDNLTSQQKFYDNDIQKHQQQQKKLQIAIESYEKQCARDKMIIKFREDRINKLESNTPQTKDDQQKLIADLKKEITLWKEAVDHNSQAAKLFAEKADLMRQLENLKTEVKQQPESLSAQMRSLTELNESLNSYLKQYCEESKNEVEKELSQVKLDYAEKIEQLNGQLSELKEKEKVRKEKRDKQNFEYEQTITSLKAEVERLEELHQKEKTEIQKQNTDAIEQIKNEIEQICENKTEQEKEVQLLRVQIMEKEQLFEREKDLRIDQERINAQKQSNLQSHLLSIEESLKELNQEHDSLQSKLVSTVTHFEIQIENERKQHSHALRELEDKQEQELREIERQLLVQSSEKEMLQEQCDQLNDRIKNLQDENETVQESLLYKEEQIKEIETLIKDKERQICTLEDQISQVQEQMIKDLEKSKQEYEQVQLLLDQTNQEKVLLQQQLKEAQADKEDLQNALNEIKQEIQEHLKEKETLLDQIQCFQKQQENQSATIAELQTAIEKKDLQIKDLAQALESQIAQNKSLEEQILSIQYETSGQQKFLESKIQEITDNFEEEKQLQEQAKAQEIENLKQEFEIILVNSSQQSKEQQEFVNNLKNEYNTQISSLSEQNKQLQVQIEAKQEQIQGQEQYIVQLNNNYQQQIAKLIEEHEQKISQIEQVIEIKEQEQKQCIQNIQKSYEENLKESQLQSEANIQKVTFEHKQQITSIIEKHQVEIQVVIQEQQQVVEQAQQEVIAIKAQTIQAQDENFKNNSLILQEERKIFKNQIQQLEQEHQENLSQLKLNFQEEELNLKNHIAEISKIKDANIIELEQKIESLEQSYNSIEHHSKSNEEQHLRLIQILENQLTATKSTVQQLQHQIDDYQSQISSQNQLTLDLENQQSQTLQKLNQSQQQITESIQQNQQLLQQLDQAILQNETLQKELDESQKLSQQMHDTIQANSQQYSIDASDKEQQIQQLKTDVEELENLNQEKENALYEQSQQLEELITEINNLKDTLQHSSRQKESLDTNSKQLSAQLDQAKKDSQQQIQQLQSELKRQQLVLDDTISQLNNEHIRKYQEQEQEHQVSISATKQELDSYKQHVKDLNTQVSKLKQRNEEQNDMLKSSKDTMSMMVQKENELMKELEKNINEFKDQQEKWKKRVTDAKEERDALRKEWDRFKKENENLRELIKLKDRQIEEQLNSDERDKQALERIHKENKDLKNQLTKREFEMKDLVKTLKFYSEEKQRLEKEIEKLHRENDQLIGHKNPSQKIQHHVKIKEENNKLREENFKLQEELRRKIDIISKQQPTRQVLGQDVVQNMGDNFDSNALREDLKRVKKDNITYQETINRLVDHILSQPGLTKAIGISEEINEKLIQQAGAHKVKKVMEIISLLNNCFQQKERESKDLEREIKKYECRLDIAEKEKILCKQQLELMQNANIGPSYSQSNSTYLKRSPINKELNSKLQQEFMMIQNLGEAHHQMKQNHIGSRLQVEGYNNDDKNSMIDGFLGAAIAKQSPSPIYNFKQQKEKENVHSKRELFGNARSGSARRTNSYLSNGQQHQQHQSQQKHQ